MIIPKHTPINKILDLKSISPFDRNNGNLLTLVSISNSLPKPLIQTVYSRKRDCLEPELFQTLSNLINFVTTQNFPLSVVVSFVRLYASVNSSSAHPPARTNPRALAFLQKKIGKFPGVGTHKLSKCPGVGTKKEGKCPAPGIVAFQHLHSFLINQ